MRVNIPVIFVLLVPHVSLASEFEIGIQNVDSRLLQLQLHHRRNAETPLLENKKNSYTSTVEKIIVGGKDVRDGKFPFQVALQHRSIERSEHFCGGTILSDSRVLTAAHCVHGMNASQIQVVAGTLNIFNPDGTQQTVGVTNIRIHEKYTESTCAYANDVAILTLVPALRMTPNKVEAIELAPANSELSGNCTISGWGDTRTAVKYPEKLQKVTLQFMETIVCAAQFEAHPLVGINPILPGMICATKTRKGPCNNDSGGPLVIKKNRRGRNILAGVISWGPTSCEHNWTNPSVFSSVPYFEEWILQGI